MWWWIVGIIVALIVGFFAGFILGAWAAHDELVQMKAHIIRKPGPPPS